MMFKQEGPVQRVEVYGTYSIKFVKPGEPWYLARAFVQTVCLAIEAIKYFREVNTCKAYCLKHGYNVSFTVYAFENTEDTDQQGEGRGFRRLIRDIEQEKIDMVLFIGFDWIRRKPELIERLLKIAEEHHTTLIDVRREEIISQPF